MYGLPLGSRLDTSQDALAVPYSSTPPSMATKVMDWMLYLAVLSRRTKLAHAATEILKIQCLSMFAMKGHYLKYF
jgi:hypothetical protein